MISVSFIFGNRVYPGKVHSGSINNGFRWENTLVKMCITGFHSPTATEAVLIWASMSDVPMASTYASVITQTIISLVGGKWRKIPRLNGSCFWAKCCKYQKTYQFTILSWDKPFTPSLLLKMCVYVHLQIPKNPYSLQKSNIFSYTKKLGVILFMVPAHCFPKSESLVWRRVFRKTDSSCT